MPSMAGLPAVDFGGRGGAPVSKCVGVGMCARIHLFSEAHSLLLAPCRVIRVMGTWRACADRLPYVSLLQTVNIL